MTGDCWTISASRGCSHSCETSGTVGPLIDDMRGGTVHGDLQRLLMIFALAMMGCVLATPLVTQIASWVGAIDRPDQFRRIHTGAIPRLGGLGLALGIAAGTV